MTYGISVERQRAAHAPLLAVLVVTGLLGLPAAPALAVTKCEKVTDEFTSPHSNAGVDFRVKDLSVRYASGPVKVVRSCTGTDKVSVDDGLTVEVTRPDGSKSSFSHDFSAGCSGVITPAGPFDITSSLNRGTNAVKVRLRDLCGQGGSSSSDIYLMYEEEVTNVIFVHGFLGSKIFCGAEELWANLPLPKLNEMQLARDGQANAGCASAGPREGQLLETALGGDVYRSTADFLRDKFPGRFHLYAWDWRKSPEAALAGLDALVDRVRASAPGTKVVLMAHSMGGLVTRLYVGDQARADKVARVLTAGTPYWGSPKAMFPFFYGVEAPGLSALDAIFDDAKLRAFARYLQGMFFLWPSASYGGWLSIDGRSGVQGQNALLDLVDEFGGNRSLLAAALGAHARRIDQFSVGGVDYQVLIGTGVHTIGAVRIAPPPFAGLSIVPERDIVHVDWVNGDGTVPLRSAVGATPQVRRHYTCGVSHVPLPGHPAVTGRAEPFLDKGEAFADPGTPTQRLCDPQGWALSVFPLEATLFASSARVRARVSQGGASMTLDEAEKQGLIEALVLPANIEAATSTLQPLTLTLPSSRGALVRVAKMTNGKREKASVYLVRGKGPVTIALTDKVVVRRGGALAKAAKNDTRAPRTSVRVKRRGKRLLLLFKVDDVSPVRTYAVRGKKAERVVGGRLAVTDAQLRKGIRYQSVDALGNAEKPRRLRRR